LTCTRRPTPRTIGAVAQEMFLRLLRTGYIYRACPCTPSTASSCKRFLADRYVEGTCPLRQPQRPRRPVRQLRPHAGRHRADRAALQASAARRPSCARPSTSSWTWASSTRRSCGVDQPGQRALAPQRPQLHARPTGIGRAARPAHHPRHPVGGAVPVEGFETSASTSGLTPSSATSRPRGVGQIRGQPEAWREWWTRRGARASSYNFIGKDNIPFHTIIWPGMLIGYGGLNLPYDVPANEYLNGRRGTSSPRAALGHRGAGRSSSATTPTRCATS
jgi:methionyl-tRNA synthetase